MIARHKNKNNSIDEPVCVHASRETRSWLPRLLWLIIMAVAFAVRVYRFGSVPGGFNQDEAMAAYDAYSLALYGTDRFGMRLPVYFTAWGYGQMSVLLSYLMVPFIWLFGLSAVTARLPMLLMSMVGLSALYVFVRDWYGKPAALTTLAFAAVCPWHIMQARWALDCNLFPHMLILGVCLLSRYLLQISLHHAPLSRLRRIMGDHRPKSDNRRSGCLRRSGRFRRIGCFQRSGCLRHSVYLWLSMIVFGLSMYTYGVAFYTVPILMVALCVSLSVKGAVTIRQTLVCVGLFGAVAWCAFAVMLINFFQWPTLYTPLFTVPFFPDTVRMNDLLPYSTDIPGQLRANFQSLYRVVVTQWDGLPWNAVSGYGLLYTRSWPFTIVGLLSWLFQRHEGTSVEVCDSAEASDNAEPSGRIILLCWLGVAIFTGLTVNGVNINRINIIGYPLIMLTGVGLYEAVRLPLRFMQNHRRAKQAALAAAITLSLAYGMTFIRFNHVYFNSHNAYLSRLFYKDFFDCLSHATREGFDRLHVTAWTQYPGGAHVSEILTLYGLRIDPVLFQNKNDYQRVFSFDVFNETPQPVQSDVYRKTVYIFNKSEAVYFPEDLFVIDMYSNFGVAVGR